MPGEKKYKSEKKEVKANYFRKNMDLLGLAASNQNLPASYSTSSTKSYLGNSLIN